MEAVVQNAIKFVKFTVTDCEFYVHKNIVMKDMDELEVKLQFETHFNDSKPKEFSVEFDIKIWQDDKISINSKAQSIFVTKEKMSEEFKKSNFTQINAPAIAFPFLRSFVQTLCVNAGIAPIILPSFNFAEAVNNSQK